VREEPCLGTFESLFLVVPVFHSSSVDALGGLVRAEGWTVSWDSWLDALCLPELVDWSSLVLLNLC